MICLNLCTGTALESVHGELFRRWPTPLHMALTDPSELESVLRPLGMQRRRTRSLIRMSISWSCLWDGGDPLDLPGIGEYGKDSYEIFVRGNLGICPRDKELKKYLAWLALSSKP